MTYSSILLHSSNFPTLPKILLAHSWPNDAPNTSLLYICCCILHTAVCQHLRLRQTHSLFCIVDSPSPLHSSLTHQGDIIPAHYQWKGSPPKCSHTSQNVLISSHTLASPPVSYSPTLASCPSSWLGSPRATVSRARNVTSPWYFHVSDIWHVTNATQTWYFHVKTWLRVKRDSGLDIFTPRKSMSAPT